MFKALISTIMAIGLVGCAHSILITPDMQGIDRAKLVPIDATAAYYISSSDREAMVVTPGGGGDKVTYAPYKELEPALQRVLFNQFKDVKRLDSPPDATTLKGSNIAYVFVPKVSTTSSSDSALTWPPTKFSVTLDCKALDGNGQQIWSKEFIGNGEATFSEFKSNFSLSAVRASQKVFEDLQSALNSAPEFRK